MAHQDPAEKFPDVGQAGMGIFVDFVAEMAQGMAQGAEGHC